MANLLNLPEPARRHLAAQIGRYGQSCLPTVPLQANQWTLGEDLEVWSVDFARLKTAKSLGEIAAPTGYWHHLIRHGGQARQLAMSKLNTKTGLRQFHALLESDLSEKIDQAMDWLDKHDKTDAKARFLSILPLGIHAFWLVRGKTQRVVLIDSVWPIKGLVTEHLYTAGQFLKIVAKQPGVRLPST